MLRSFRSEYIVQTMYGPVQGRPRTGVRDVAFYSFQGIPYAQPPVGELRFKVYQDKLKED